MVAKGAGALFRSLVPEGRLSFAQLGHSGTGWSWMDDLDGEPLQTLKESKKETQHLFCLKGTNISHLGKRMEKDNPLQTCLGRGYVHSQEGIGWYEDLEFLALLLREMKVQKRGLWLQILSVSWNSEGVFSCKILYLRPIYVCIITVDKMFFKSALTIRYIKRNLRDSWRLSLNVLLVLVVAVSFGEVSNKSRALVTYWCNLLWNHMKSTLLQTPRNTKE